MKSTQHLYNCSPTEFADLPYREALVFKRDKAKERLTELTYQHYSVRDDEHINAVSKAHKLNINLLEELNEPY